MNRFDVRLEAQDGSGHFRTTSVVAKDKKTARRECERREYEFAAFRLNAEQEKELCESYSVDSIDELPRPAARDASAEEKAPFRALATKDRGLLCAHWQEQPHKVVSVEPRKGV